MKDARVPQTASSRNATCPTPRMTTDHACTRPVPVECAAFRPGNPHTRPAPAMDADCTCRMVGLGGSTLLGDAGFSASCVSQQALSCYEYDFWSLPDDVAGRGFSRGSSISPAPSFRRRSIYTSINLIGSQDLAPLGKLSSIVGWWKGFLLLSVLQYFDASSGISSYSEVERPDSDGYNTQDYRSKAVLLALTTDALASNTSGRLSPNQSPVSDLIAACTTNRELCAALSSQSGTTVALSSQAVKLQSTSLNITSSKSLPGTEGLNMPHVFVDDEAFSISCHVKIPYCGKRDRGILLQQHFKRLDFFHLYDNQFLLPTRLHIQFLPCPRRGKIPQWPVDSNVLEDAGERSEPPQFSGRWRPTLHVQ
ncbi:hypothetical protein PR048_000105 [Dryococelus australis]|uniref:Uncharacterized protein n=1 Tax=Dryococelus australis TaxID=614101 RepID=A0ABQ9IDP7_9NEOP|nr:hypothetical protein PR048_000105 [Dryococelus australis]